MRKELCICDVCHKEIKISHPLEFEIWIRKEIAEKLEIGEFAHGLSRRRRRVRGKFTMCYIDVCSKACFIKFLEAIKDA